MTSILITRASGFVGNHLVNHLLNKGENQIWGLSRGSKSPTGQRNPKIRWVEGSLSNRAFLRELLNLTQPSFIYHLAGQAQVAKSWESPAETMTANVLDQIHLMEALREFDWKPAILIAGSSEEYGSRESRELPVREDSALLPLSPYAVSKVAQDMMAYQYFRSYGFHVVRTRAFNHTGPGRPEYYAISNFSKQIATIEACLAEPILHVGNLQAQRDYLDVRDMVRGYELALAKGESGEVYNICSGEARSMETILNDLLKHSSIAIRIQQDPSRLRPSDLPVMYGDASKFKRRTGWTPQVPFEQTLLDLLNYWRDQVKTQTSKRQKEGIAKA